jgi:transposase
MPQKKRRSFTPEFKSQMVQLFGSGKSRASIVREYDLTASALDRWISQIRNRDPSQQKRTAHHKRMSLSHCVKKSSA